MSQFTTSQMHRLAHSRPWWKPGRGLLYLLFGLIWFVVAHHLMQGGPRGTNFVYTAWTLDRFTELIPRLYLGLPIVGGLLGGAVFIGRGVVRWSAGVLLSAVILLCLAMSVAWLQDQGGWSDRLIRWMTS
ncbi:MAG: hypothetical protein AAGB29_07815 [Planctomycetota bacterium]